MSNSQPAHRTARERVRAEVTSEIVDAARRQLAIVGAAALSLRAVARDLGMVSSAVYRYVPSRDTLLTMLIVDAYDALGAAVETAEGAIDRADLLGRWIATGTAVRDWGLAHPHDWALIFGSPVPGYAAPQDTVRPASRVPEVLCGILADAVSGGRLDKSQVGEVSAAVGRAMAPVRTVIPRDRVPDPVMAGGLTAWAGLIGAVSFELFGHHHNVIDDHETFFGEELRRLITLIGLRS
ncbi:MAG: TetR/AcrR family transcriptional regulator [Pseudonocardiaceae bacterium]